MTTPANQSPYQFALTCERFAAEAERRVRAVRAEAAGIVFDSVTQGSTVTGSQGTPVRTGRLLRSWVPTINSPAPDGAEYRGSARMLFQAVGERDTLIIRNTAPYIEPVESRTAKQKPTGWVTRATLGNWRAIVAEAVRRVRARGGRG